MALTNEEIAADLTWRYVEHLRERTATGNHTALSLEELAELRRALEMAGEVPDVLATDWAPAEARERLRARLDTQLDTAASPALVAPNPPSTPLLSSPGGTRPRGGWRFLWHSVLTGTAGTAIGLAAAVISVGIWHPTPTPIRVVAERPADVAPISEQVAHTLIPEMIENRLAPGQEKNLMWHMLVCPGCFQEYTQLRGHQRVQAPEPPDHAQAEQIALHLPL